MNKYIIVALFLLSASCKSTEPTTSQQNETKASDNTPSGDEIERVVQTPPTDETATVEVLPELIGGFPELYKKLVYPPAAVSARVQGRVIVKFLVSETGLAHSFEIVKGIGSGCDQAAIKALSLSRFTPGTQGGKPVVVEMVMPVIFRLRT